MSPISGLVVYLQLELWEQEWRHLKIMQKLVLVLVLVLVVAAVAPVVKAIKKKEVYSGLHWTQPLLLHAFQK